MTRFRVLVVDDEPLAREVAVSLLRRDSEVAAVAEEEDLAEAVVAEDGEGNQGPPRFVIGCDPRSPARSLDLEDR